MKIITHPLYLAPVSHYVRLYASDGALIDACAPFTKQTFRNRAVIATENGTQSLTIPVIHDGGNRPMRDIRISEHGNWRHLHWNALVSAYRKSPFFEYYADDFAHFYEERDGYLMDFNLRLHAVVCELLGLEREITIADEIITESDICEDIRPAASPKIITEKATALPYYQVFAARNGFIPDTSIIDLLFNMGPEALIVLRDSGK